MTDSSRAFLTTSRHYLRAGYLPRIERCLELLDTEDIWRRPNPSSNSIGNLLLHLAGNVRQWIVSGVGGAPDQRQRAQEFAEQEPIPAQELLDRLRAALEEADRVLEAQDEAALQERRHIQGRDVSVLEAIYHVVEHFSMHTGQIIYITKMRTGKDLGFYEQGIGR